MTPEIAIIGGTGFTQPRHFQKTGAQQVETPHGAPSSELVMGSLFGRPVAFLPRHGDPHRIPPHKVNYRANLWALKSIGIRQVLAIAAVGGITPEMQPSRLVLPDQIIDYTYGRSQTFFEDGLESVVHIDFSEPYSCSGRDTLLEAARKADVPLVSRGVYGCTQGPRLETPAEIARMERDGCDLVGMTGMPEACLAREIGLDYVCLAVVANWAAGKSQGEILLEEIHANIDAGMKDLFTILESWLEET